MITEIVIKKVQKTTTNIDHMVKDTKEDNEDKVDIIKEMALLMKVVSNSTMRTLELMIALSDRTREVAEKVDIKNIKGHSEIFTTLERSTTHLKST
jgi:hypothetical protein